MGILEGITGYIVLGVTTLLTIFGFIGGKKMADAKHAKEAANELKEVVNEVKEAAEIRTTVDADPHAELRKQSGGDS